MRTSLIGCFFLMLLLKSSAFPQVSVPWTSMDGPYSGIVQCMVQAHDGSLFLGTDVSGVYRSTDDGKSWTQMNKGLSDMDVWALGVEPDGHVLAVSYLRPNEAGSYSPMQRSPQGRLFRSTNLGTTWALIDTVPAGTRLTVNSKGYIWTETYADDFGGLVRSTNGGTSWASQALGNAVWIRSLAMDSSGNLYQGVSSSNGTVNSGIHKSTNDGGSWTSLSSEVTPLTLGYKRGGYLFIGSTAGVSRVTTSGTGYVLLDNTWQANAFAFASSGTVYATATDGSVRKSTDNGVSWSVARTYALRAQRVFCPDGTNIFVSGQTDFLSHTTEASTRWNSITNGFKNAQVPSVVCTGTGALLAGSGCAVWRTTDKGGSWEALTDPPTRPEEYVRGVSSSYPPYYVWALCRQSEQTIVAAEEMHSYSSATGGFTRRFGVVSISTNGGNSWGGFVTGTGTTSASGTILPHALAVGLTGDIYVGGESAFGRRSGATFSIVSGSLDGKVVTSLVRDATDRLFAGTVDYGVFRSTDHGDSWTVASGGLPNLDIYALALDSTGRLYAGSTNGLYTSTSGGTTWATGTGFPTARVQAIATAPGGHVYVATTTYVYFSGSYGTAPWTQLSTGLPFGDIASLTLGPDGEIYAGTWGAGVYWRPAWTGPTAAPGSDQVSIPVHFVLEQNYPNPFNPTSTIRYGLPSRSTVRLAVFDALGRQVALLVEGEEGAGYHEVLFNADGLSTGVYFCRLQAADHSAGAEPANGPNGAVQIRKLLLVR